jgi:hypothetical protein
MSIFLCEINIDVDYSSKVFVFGLSDGKVIFIVEEALHSSL